MTENLKFVLTRNLDTGYRTTCLQCYFSFVTGFGFLYTSQPKHLLFI